METYELSPDGRRSIETYRTLEQAIERATVLLTSRVDVQNFHILVTSRVGHRLIGLVSRDKGFRPVTPPGEEEGASQ
jgi:hypothetical protein